MFRDFSFDSAGAAATARPHVEIIEGDCRSVVSMLESGSIDSIVTDPPYHLTSGSGSRGFMGQTWDGGDVAFRAETWAEMLRVLKPGGHVVAFSGTRTYHRMACAIEDAGFEIRDQVGWCYGTGFPKSHNVGNGWGTALKPAWEPIVLARKPIVGTVADNVLEHGTGAINVDGCRIEGESTRRTNRAEMGYHGGNLAAVYQTGSDAGRWPANVLHDGSAEVLKAFGKLEADWRTSPARFFYSAKASKADRGDGNNHPTVKPTALMRWLCRLVTPPGGVVLDPFAGSASTGVGAQAEGFGFIGIEMTPAYAAIARRRLGIDRVVPSTAVPYVGVFA